MSVQAYITAGQTVIPVLLPDEKMRDTARQIGLPETDLFRIDVPASMSRHLSASVLLASTQMSALYASQTVSLTLEDSSGFSITMSGLYARPPQPFYWTEQGGVAMVELVDQRWYWRFSTSGLLDKLLTVAYFSDGRWQDNGVDSTTPPDPSDKITTFEELWDLIEAEITAINLTMPTEPSWPNWTDAERAANLRRLSDFVGTQTVSISMLIDVIGMVIGGILRYTGSGYSYTPKIGLKGAYDTSMDSYRVAMRGGMQPTNGTVTSTDVLVTQWQATGYQARAPLKASAVYPYHAVEARTYYDNCARHRVPTGGMSFLASAIYTSPEAAPFSRQPNDIGVAWLPESAVVTRGDVGQPLQTAPGWELDDIKIVEQYANRYNYVPFGRTVWAGWIPFSSIGQIGNVSYRLALIDGQMSPYTITSCDENDWIFGMSGAALNKPEEVIVGKGLAQSYRNCVGATIIDVAPPNCRIFPARITASEQPAEFEGTWKWRYGFEEVEPNPDILNPDSYVPVNEYGRNTNQDLVARNMAEEGNVFVSAGNAGNVVAPGVYQSDVTTGTIEALPISSNTIVMMCEQFLTIAPAFTDPDDPQATIDPPHKPQYWFSMPNAVKVTCTPQE